MVSKRVISAIVLSLLVVVSTRGQEYEVAPLGINHWERATFSPVWYQGGIVFCGDRHKDNLKSVYYQGTSQEPTDIYFISSTDPQIYLFASEFTSEFSDGPITFARADTFCFFSRNVQLENEKGKHRKQVNRLGIYSAEKEGRNWINITPFEYNSDEYSITTPALNKSGTKLCFASDMPGGFGGFDLYTCDLTEKGWGKPRNMGRKINTPGNELFPTWSSETCLFFSSDSMETGLGGLDLYQCKFDGKQKIVVPLPAPINGSHDDFGILAAEDLQKGYFSSNRYGNDQIYSFKTSTSLFEDCDTMVSQTLCYNFSDKNADPVSGSLIYEWDMGDGTKQKGLEITHCYAQPGKYDISLQVIDTLTRRTVMERDQYTLLIEVPEQPHIGGAKLADVGQEVEFDATDSRLPGLTGKEYYWSFGDGFQAAGEKVTHKFTDGGTYDIKLAATGFRNGQRVKSCSFRKIRVYRASFNFQALVKDSVEFLPEPFPESELTDHLGPGYQHAPEGLAAAQSQGGNAPDWDAHLYFRPDPEANGFDYKKLLADSLGLSAELLADVELLWHYVNPDRSAAFNYEQLLRDGAELAKDSLWDPELILTFSVEKEKAYEYHKLDPDRAILGQDSTWTVQLAWNIVNDEDGFDYKKLIRDATNLSQMSGGQPEIIWKSTSQSQNDDFNYEKLAGEKHLAKYLAGADPAILFRNADKEAIAAFHYNPLTKDQIPLKHEGIENEPMAILTSNTFKFRKLPSNVIYTPEEKVLQLTSRFIDLEEMNRGEEEGVQTHKIVVYESDKALAPDHRAFRWAGDRKIDQQYRADDGRYIYTTGRYNAVDEAHKELLAVIDEGCDAAMVQQFEIVDVSDKQTNQMLRELIEVTGFDSSKVVLERIRIFQNIQFDSDSYVLRHDAKSELRNMAKFMQSHPDLVLDIWAHADATATAEYNKELTSLRAFSVAKFIEQQGVAKYRLYPVSFGETRPIASNLTEEGKAMNRRVEFRFRQIEAELPVLGTKPSNPKGGIQQ